MKTRLIIEIVRGFGQRLAGERGKFKVMIHQGGNDFEILFDVGPGMDQAVRFHDLGQQIREFIIE